MKLESWHSNEDKKHWEIVRTDSCTYIQGEILYANEDTGECSVCIDGENKTLILGEDGIKIVERRKFTFR